MIRFILFLLSILFFQICEAQLDRDRQLSFDRDKYEENLIKKGLITVEGGIGIPFNEFASKSIASNTSGYAQNGFNITLSFRYAFTPTLGATFKFLNTSNPFDAQTYQNQLNQNSAPYILNYSTLSTNYQINGFMAGPTYIIPSRKMNFETSVCVGYLNGTLPANSLTFTPGLPVQLNTTSGVINTKILNFSQTAYSASNFAVSFDIAFRYMLSKNLIFTASADVLITDLTFKSMMQSLTDTAGYIYTGSIPDYLQPFRLIHLKIGIGYQFE